MKTTIFSERLSQFRFTEYGQAILEFALMLPCLILLNVGIVELGRTIYYTIETNNAATAGASYGADQPSLSSGIIVPMQNAAIAEANMGSLMTATATYGCTCDPRDGSTRDGTSCTYPVPAQSSCGTISCSGQIVHCVQVTTHATISPIFHYPGLPSTYEANGRAVMRNPNY